MNVVFCAWLSASCILFLMEISFPNLFLYTSCALGSFVTAFFSFICQLLSIQIVLFLLISIISLYALRFSIQRTMQSWDRVEKDTLIGRHAIVVDTITHTIPGYVRVQDSLWMARSHNNSFLQKGEIVSIVAVRGAHVVVRQSKSNVLKETLC